MRCILKFVEEKGLQLELDGRKFGLCTVEEGLDEVDLKRETVRLQGQDRALHPGDCLELGGCRLIYLGGLGRSALIQMGKLKAILTFNVQAEAENARALQADFLMMGGEVFAPDGEKRFCMEPGKGYSVYDIMNQI